MQRREALLLARRAEAPPLAANGPARGFHARLKAGYRRRCRFALNPKLKAGANQPLGAGPINRL